MTRKRLLAERTTRIDSSGIRKVFALGAKLKNPCNLSIGQPDYDVPDPVKEAAIQAIRNGENRYTQTAGLDELREKILNHYRESRRIPADDCLITSGTSGGILLAFMALFDPGDEVLVPDPYFVMYKHLLNLIGAKPVFVDTYPDFRLRREDLEARVTPAAKALIVNSPNNPTGIVYTREELRMAAEFCREHDLLLISDEIYEPFVYEGDAISAGEFEPNALILSGFSKSCAMTGWRVGYALGPSAIIKAMTEIQQYTFVCAPSMAQRGAMTAFDFDTAGNTAEYRKKRDRIYNGLSRRYRVERSGGAFYIFPEAPNGDGDAFVKRAIEKELLIVPGSVFSERKTHFRISFAATDAALDRGIGILDELAAEFAP